MKTPDEIKKALTCDCDWPDCEDCAYATKVEDKEFGEILQFHCSEIYKDAYDLIIQLESRLAQVERERDAAVDDLENASPCFACYNFFSNKGACKGGMRCHDDQFKAAMWHLEYKGPDWQWRGVCVENTKEDTTDEPT